MEELFMITWNLGDLHLYLSGFCPNGSTQWVLNSADAHWFLLERADNLIKTIQVLENISQIQVEQI